MEEAQGRASEPTQRAVAYAALKAAFPYTVPILAGFLFLGATSGVYAGSLGLPWWVPPLMAVIIFGGSAEFIVASMLPGAFDPISTFVVILVVQARHLFYGLSMLERFRGAGRKRPYLIYAMCDETFSITCSTHAPQGVDEHWFMLFVSLLNQLYWVVGCAAGGIFGQLLPLDIEGVSFAMTALFVVIFMDQWMKEPNHVSSIVGVLATAGALVLFGADAFLIPAMLIILVAMLAARKHLEPIYAPDDPEEPGSAPTAPGAPTGQQAQAGERA